MVIVIDGRRRRISQDLRGFFLTRFLALTEVFFLVFAVVMFALFDPLLAVVALVRLHGITELARASPQRNLLLP